MRKLNSELYKKNVNVELCTTRTDKLVPFIRSGVLWDNTLSNESIDNIRITRFDTKNPNKFLSLIFEKAIQYQLDKEESLSVENLERVLGEIYDAKGGVLLTGWNHLERFGSLEMRWTKRQASILIRDDNMREVAFSVMNRKMIDASLTLRSQDYEQSLNLPKGKEWTGFKVALPDVSGNLFLSFEQSRVWRPLKDHRALGIAISDISYKTDKHQRILNMDYDYKKFLIIKGLYVDHLVSNAISRPKIYSHLFDYLRGPDSSHMVKWLNRCIRNYDVVMAQMFPFNTIKYSMIAKKHGKPLALLPLIHVDDDFYHWRHYYEFLREADVVFAISKYSKTSLFDKIGVNSIYVGAGIDRDIFLNDNINGNNFREKYNMANKDIILTVSRKSGSKRYDLIIDAVAKVRDEFKNAHLVMIGPDEDKFPINSEDVSYLGTVSEADLANAYDACDIFAMMSESESFGMVFCEAWSRRKPVIGNAYCGAVSTLIDNGSDGFLCSDADEIAERIRMLLSDKELAKRFGTNGFEKVIENYTWDKVANKIHNCYRMLIG